MKTLTKPLKSQWFAVILALSLCLPLCISEAHAFSIGRSDGTWLFPLASNYYNSFSDWAGCPGMDRCPICGESHRNVNGVNWGDAGPYSHSGQGGHNGIDIAAGTGTSVLAAAPGTVRVSTTRGGARGYYIVIEHPIDGTNYSYYSYYQHLSRLSVSVGQYVNAGTTIGAVGSTGGNYGAHLHFGIVIGSKGTNIASRLGTIESYGWILTDGYREGRILNNPSAQSAAPRGESPVVPPLNYHKGSTTYTFDASQVSIGGGNSESQLKINPTAYPTGSLRKGSYFSLQGTISSNYTLSSVKGEILNASNHAVRCSYTQYPGTTSFSLLNSGIDYNMTFNMLAPGNYILRYTATDTSNKTVSWTSPMFTIQSGLTISAGRYNPGTFACVR